ncbi:MAG: ribose-5-phosphate isomerase RpiA [Alphaproteobacteria bacterium]|nr:ribose-5-phosphate isomerase RpiA [Alphaproteobacteria bacterium]MBV8548594.1 ribose-5-phosphate isomerase RpiA [Alphaproteobacteria bacterium]
MDVHQQKQQVGIAASRLIKTNMIVGLGTGSTAACFVEALAERVRHENLLITCVATSVATAAFAQKLGLKVVELDTVSYIDVTVDGADECDGNLNLIKGGGSAHLREKLVSEYSRYCVAIADISKKVSCLGQFPLPVEVVRFGHVTTAARLRAVLQKLGYDDVPPTLRLNKEGGVVVTDGGNVIYDLPCGVIKDVNALAQALKAVTGVVEHGLFIGLTDEALFASPDGVQSIKL